MSNDPRLATANVTATAPNTAAKLGRYYRWHAWLYDATRWIFLFGRTRLIRSLAAYPQPNRILEIGCGTGSNLLLLRQQFPDAAMTGLDLSADMLAQAHRKLRRRSNPITLMQRRYDQPLQPASPFDLIVCSYCLSMINPGWEQVLESALQDLTPSGLLAVVDFHDTRFPTFHRWMAFNHVRLGGHLLPRLNASCQPLAQQVTAAYGGSWRYFSFIGQR